MASYPIVFVIFLLIAALLPAITLGKEFIVGDEVGWTKGFDYKTWTAGKEFHVGDKLVFRYPVGVHNVHKVNGTDFKKCSVPQGSDLPLTTGNDVLTLATPGRKWYLCDVGKHCENGQKLFITVQPAAPSLARLSQADQPQALPAYYSSKGSKGSIYQLASMLTVALVTLIVA